MKAVIDFDSLEQKVSDEYVSVLKATVMHLAEDYPEFVQIEVEVMSQPAETEKTEKVAVAHLMVQSGPKQWITICGWKFASSMTVEFMISPYAYDGEIRPCKDCQGKIDNFNTWRVKS